MDGKAKHSPTNDNNNNNSLSLPTTGTPTRYGWTQDGR